MATTRIRTPDRRLRVFISSTLGELAEERQAALAAVEQLRLAPIMFELVTHVTVKVRTSTFFTRSRIRKLREPTIDPAVVSTAALGMLALFDLHRPIRLLGIRVVLES